MWQDPVVLCVDIAKYGFGKTRIQGTCNFPVLFKQGHPLPVTKEYSDVA